MAAVIKGKILQTLKWTSTIKLNQNLSLKQLIQKEIKQQKKHTTRHAVIGLVISFILLIVIG